jgi:hypothetical protein
MPEMIERIAELRRELESNPLSRQFYQLGELLRRDGRAEESIEVLRAGLRHHPRYVAAWVSLGRACLDVTRPKDAAEALHEALELDAQNPVAWRLLGEARLGGGDRFGALDAMQHALQLAPGDDVLRAAVDSLASETWPPQAGPVATEAGALDATQPMSNVEFAPTVMLERYVDERPPAAAAPAVVATEPFFAAAPPPAIPSPVPVAVAPVAPRPIDLDDPFAVPVAVASLDGVADVFAPPVAQPSFADEPFGFAVAPAPQVAQPTFLAEFVPLETVAPAPVWAAVPAPAEPEVEVVAEVAAPVAAPAATEAVFAADEGASAVPVGAAFAEPELPEAVTAAESAEAPQRPVEAVEPLPEPVTAPAPFAAEPSATVVESESDGARPTLTMARLYLQQQDFPAAITILERLVRTSPENQEARDLLELVHDMMAPLPGELPLASVRERRIAALQGWLASLTLGQERVGR